MNLDEPINTLPKLVYVNFYPSPHILDKELKLKVYRNAFDFLFLLKDNFQITVLAASFLLVILSAALKLFLILAFIVGIAGLAFAIYGGVQAKKTGSYTYPFAVRLLK